MRWLVGICVVFFLVGCPKKPVVKPPEKEVEKPPEVKIEKPPERIEVTTPTVVTPPKPPEEPKIKFPTEFATIPEIKTIYFDFDVYELSEDARKKLAENAELLKKNPQLLILIEGHCCECGSSEYNLGLGEKRANEMKRYYISLGISEDRISTVSYGEEKPVYKNAGPPDSALCAFNRRGITKVKIAK